MVFFVDLLLRLFVLVSIEVPFGTIAFALFDCQSTARKQAQFALFQLLLVHVSDRVDALLNALLVLELLCRMIQGILLVLLVLLLACPPSCFSSKQPLEGRRTSSAFCVLAPLPVSVLPTLLKIPSANCWWLLHHFSMPPAAAILSQLILISMAVLFSANFIPGALLTLAS